MKFSTAIALAIASISFIQFVGSSAEARDRVDRRQVRQQARIHQGRESGEITQDEAARLRMSRRAVRRAERRAEKDGVVSPDEAARLERMQDARSRQIHRLKNNDNSAAPGAPTAPVEPAAPTAEPAQQQ